jgi:hypothetical protein
MFKASKENKNTGKKTRNLKVKILDLQKYKQPKMKEKLLTKSYKKKTEKILYHLHGFLFVVL